MAPTETVPGCGRLITPTRGVVFGSAGIFCTPELVARLPAPVRPLLADANEPVIRARIAPGFRLRIADQRRRRAVLAGGGLRFSVAHFTHPAWKCSRLFSASINHSTLLVEPRYAKASPAGVRTMSSATARPAHRRSSASFPMRPRSGLTETIWRGVVTWHLLVLP